jgi:hypothetical protein
VEEQERERGQRQQERLFVDLKGAQEEGEGGVGEGEKQPNSDGVVVVFCFVGDIGVLAVSIAADGEDDAWEKTSTQTGARSKEVAPRLSLMLRLVLVRKWRDEEMRKIKSI